ncbi:MAG: Gldg family protein [Planctomycetota bacterium]
MSKSIRTILAAILIAVIAVSAMLLLEKAAGRARVDLTQDRVYTLSDGTRNILAKLGAPVRLKLYYSRAAAMKGPEGIRYYNNYYLYVRSLLEEYVALAKGKLSLEEVDPRAYSEAEEEALAHGVKRFPISEEEGFFFGLVAQTGLGKEAVIDFFEPDRQQFIEYDISKLLVGVTAREKKKIAVLSSLPVMGSDMSPYMMQMMQMQGRQPEPPWTIVTQLREKYEVTSMEKDAEAVGHDVDFLMIVHPKDFSDKTLFAIDQYVMRGGKLLVFIDPYCVSDRPPQDPTNPYAAMGHKAASNLNELLSHWGVEMDPDLIAADRRLAIKATVQRNRPAQPIITYLAVTDENMSPDEVITAKLHSLKVLFAGSLKKTNAQGVAVTPLLTTTATGNTWKPGSPFELMMLDPETIRRAVTDGAEPLLLACRLSGKFQTNFPDGPPGQKQEPPASQPAEPMHEQEAASQPSSPDSQPAAETQEAPSNQPPKEEKPAVIREAAEDASVVVIADVDMISDMLAYQETFFGPAQVGDNASLVLNTVDYLAGSADLIAIRSRGRVTRPFTVVDEIEQKAEAATAAEVDAVSRKITEYEDRLRKLGESANEENVKLVKSAVLAERQEIQKEIREARRQLRKLNAGKREKIEALAWKIETETMVSASAAVLIIAIALAVVRYARAKRYVARRAQQ